MPISTVSAGKIGEKTAIGILLKNGYKILETNFRTRYGEIDIIAEDYDKSTPVLVFVEVKTRWSDEYGLPEEAVTPRKIRGIVRAGQYYKLTHPNTPELLRIDVVAIEVRNESITAVRLIKNAGFF